MGIRNRILIVDDNTNLREDMKGIITKDDTSKEIDIAQNEYQALSLLKFKNYDVIVTDIKLDEAGGTETGGLKILEAAIEKNRKAKVIVVTAFGKMEVPINSKEDSERIPIEKKAITMGAFRCIQRPHPQKNYLEEVREYVNLALKAQNI